MKNTLVALAACISFASVAAAGVPGPVKVSPDGRHFVDRSGAPFFWLGDTAWPLFTQYSKEQAEAYLSNRAAKGFTVIQGVLAWGHGSGMEEKLPVANPQGQTPWLDGDPTRPNPAYFEYVDHLVEYADSKGLVLAMLPTWGYYVKEVSVLNTGNARAYGRWLGARYKNAPNVVWVNGGDRTPTGFEDVFRELARGLREGDGGAHLITYHPCGWRSSAQFFHGEDWLDFNMIETWTEWAKIHPAVVADAAPSAEKAHRPRRRRLRGRPRVPPGPDHPPPRQAPGLVDGHGRRLPHLRPEPDVAHGARLGQDLRHPRRRAGLPDAPHRHRAPLVGPPPRPGRLRDRHRQRAHPERRHALEGRHPRSSSTSRAPRPSSSTSTRSRRRPRRPPGSARSPAKRRTRAPSPRATTTARSSPALPHPVLQDPGLLGGRGPAAARASN